MCIEFLRTHMIDNRTFLKVCWLAVASGWDLTGFGNGLDSKGSTYVRYMMDRHPDLQQFVSLASSLSEDECYRRYSEYNRMKRS